MTLLDSFDPDNGHADGERRRDAALSYLADRQPAVIRRLQRAAVRIALEADKVTADDVRAAVPIPLTINPKVNGAALNALAILGILIGGDYIRSARPVAHARPVRVWHLADRITARLWLATNPELSDRDLIV